MTRLVFFGSSAYVLPILDTLKSKFELALVATTEQKPTDAVLAYCKQHNIPYLPLQQWNNEAMEQLQTTNAPFAILADFGLIIPQEVLDIFSKGILNIHPSLLPLYRGPTPVQTVLLNGDTTTGVSIIKLDAELDHGSLLDQKEYTIQATDTADSLYKTLFAEGAQMLSKVIPQYLSGDLPLKEQDHTKVTFTKQRLTKQDGFVDAEHLPNPQQLDHMIRAYYPWPGVWTKLRIKNQEVRIKLLPEQKLQVEGKKPVTYKDCLNGYPQMQEFISKLP